MSGLVAEEEQPRLKGGKISRRDRWYGLAERPDFGSFRRWWHRDAKFEYDTDYISDREKAERVYEDWVSAGRPKASE